MFIALEVLRVERLANTQEVQKGVELGKKQLRAVMNTINSNIEMGTVINAGPFLYMLLKEGNPEHHMFAHPCSIRLLGKFFIVLFCDFIVLDSFDRRDISQHCTNISFHFFEILLSIRSLGIVTNSAYVNAQNPYYQVDSFLKTLKMFAIYGQTSEYIPSLYSLNSHICGNLRKFLCHSKTNF